MELNCGGKSGDGDGISAKGRGRNHQLELLPPCSFPVGERIGKAASQGEEFKCHLLNSQQVLMALPEHPMFLGFRGLHPSHPAGLHFQRIVWAEGWFLSLS